MISLILAMDKNNLVGDSNSTNGLPWHYKEDLQFFKEKTINKKNIMGRVTFEQINKLLPNRESYILSTDKNYYIEGATTINNIEDVLELDKAEEEIMIIGGVKVFNLFIKYADKIYLTRINKNYQGDIFYNDFSLEGFKLNNEYYGENKDLLFQEWIKC